MSPRTKLFVSSIVVGALVSANADAREPYRVVAPPSEPDLPFDEPEPAPVADHGRSLSNGESESAGRVANNSVFLEFGGAALFASLNYERTFGDFSGRIGVGPGLISGATSASSYSRAGSTSLDFLVPLTVSYLGVGSPTHMLELGAGATVFHVSNDTGTPDTYLTYTSSGSGFGVFGNLIAGYRLQPPKGGFTLHAGVDGVIASVKSWPILPWPYVSVGMAVR